MRPDLETVDGEPRLPPLAPRSWPPQMADALAPLKPPVPRSSDQPKGLNVLGTLAHHPALVGAYHVFVRHLLYESTLPARQRELLILRVAALRGAGYEWAQHVVQAADAGLSREEILAASGRDLSGWQPLEAALLSAVDELVADARIAGPTWAVLAAELSEQQLMDLVFTVGGYEMLAMAMRSFGVPLDDDLRAWVAAYFE